MRATERLAERTGPTIGELLNAICGNAPELIITLAALREGLYDVIKAALAGSVIGNVLLVLGSAALAGGLRHHTKHRELFAAAPADAMRADKDGLRAALLRLGLATLLTACMSDILVGSVEQAAAALSLGTAFLSVFVVAAVGNAAALLTAIRAARRDRMDLALSIGIGGSTQVALLVAPAAVLGGLVLGPAGVTENCQADGGATVGCAAAVPANRARRPTRARWAVRRTAAAFSLIAGKAAFLAVAT